MSEVKRTSLTSISSNKKEKKSKHQSKTVRFFLTLPESNEEACPEFNYSELLKSVERKQKNKDNSQVNGLDPLAEDDDEHLKQIARQFEQKYGTSGAKKKHGRLEDYVDLGAGYDESDPFIDNTDAYDEVVPEEMTTAHGGFYINCGALEFKEVEEQSDPDDDDKDAKPKKRIKAKAIVEHYSRSPSTRKRLHTVMEEMVLPVLELIQFVDTRWSSEYNMLSRLHAVRKAVGAELANSENNIEILTEVEWKQAAGIVEVLGPLADATKEINKALKSRFSFYDSDPIFCPSMLCDPRFRGVLIDDMVAVNTLAIEVKKLSDKSSLEPNVKDEQPSCSSSSGLWSSFDSIPNTTQPAIDNYSERLSSDQGSDVGKAANVPIKKPKLDEEDKRVELVKKKRLSVDDVELQKRKKKKELEMEELGNKTPTVKELVKEKRETLEMDVVPESVVLETNNPMITPEAKNPMITPEVKSSMITPEGKSPLVTPEVKKLENTSISDAIESVVNAARVDDECSKDSASSLFKSPSVSAPSSDTENSQDAEGKEKLEVKEELKLPDDLTEDLLEMLDSLKKAATSSAEGKCKFFSGDVNKTLLRVEDKCRGISASSRQAVYGHLASYLPCTKDTLMKRAKKLLLEHEEEKIKAPLRKLKDAIDHMMPLVLESYSKECQKAVEEKLWPAARPKFVILDLHLIEFQTTVVEEARLKWSTEDCSSPGDDLVNKSKVPRRRFPWTAELRCLLHEVIRVKLHCMDVLRPRRESPHDALTSFLEREVKPLWPPGWMKVSVLLKESTEVVSARSISRKLVNTVKKSSAISSGPTPSVVSVQGPTVHTITATVTSSALPAIAIAKTPAVSLTGKVSHVTPSTKITPISSTVDITSVSTTGKITPISSAVNKTPISSAVNKTPVSSAVNKTPVSSAVNKTPVSSVTNKTPVSSVVNKTPVSSAVNITPVSSAVNITPVSSAAKITPVYSAAKLTPVSSAAKLTPVSSAAKLTPVSSAAKLTPASSAAKLAPASSAAKLTPASSAAKLTPASSVAKLTPASSVAKLTPASSAAKLTPASSAAKLTPVSSPVNVISVTSGVKITPVSSSPRISPTSVSKTPISTTVKFSPVSTVTKSPSLPAAIKPSVSMNGKPSHSMPVKTSPVTSPKMDSKPLKIPTSASGSSLIIPSTVTVTKTMPVFPQLSSSLSITPAMARPKSSTPTPTTITVPSSITVTSTNSVLRSPATPPSSKLANVGKNICGDIVITKSSNLTDKSSERQCMTSLVSSTRHKNSGSPLTLDLSTTGVNRTISSTIGGNSSKTKGVIDLSVNKTSPPKSSSPSTGKSSPTSLPLNIPDCISVVPSLFSSTSSSTTTSPSIPLASKPMNLKQKILKELTTEQANRKTGAVTLAAKDRDDEDVVEVIEIVKDTKRPVENSKMANSKLHNMKKTDKQKTETKGKSKREVSKSEVVSSVVPKKTNPEPPPLSEKEVERRLNEETAAATDILSQINESLLRAPCMPVEISHNTPVEERVITESLVSHKQSLVQDGAYVANVSKTFGSKGKPDPQPADAEKSVQLEVDRVMKELMELQGHISEGKLIETENDPKSIQASGKPDSQVNKKSKTLVQKDGPNRVSRPVLPNRRPSKGFQEAFQKHIFQEIPLEVDESSNSVYSQESHPPVNLEAAQNSSIEQHSQNSVRDESTECSAASSNLQSKKRNLNNTPDVTYPMPTSDDVAGFHFMGQLLSQFHDVKKPNAHTSQTGNT
uniref:Ubinuclein-2 n=2 Tax=Timema TaxID=61471 RepID=A0A7R9FVU0_TIMSH|nr:unnamed protein product [Timema shepardi]